MKKTELTFPILKTFLTTGIQPERTKGAGSEGERCEHRRSALDGKVENFGGMKDDETYDYDLRSLWLKMELKSVTLALGRKR